MNICHIYFSFFLPCRTKNYLIRTSVSGWMKDLKEHALPSCRVSSCRHSPAFISIEIFLGHNYPWLWGNFLLHTETLTKNPFLLGCFIQLLMWHLNCKLLTAVDDSLSRENDVL